MTYLAGLLLLLYAVQTSGGGVLHAPPVVQTEHRQELVGMVRLTAYSCYAEPCRNALGVRPSAGTVGVPLEGPAAFALGTTLMIDGLGRAVVADRCPGCEGLWLDYFVDDGAEEVQFGRKERLVWVVE